VGIYPTHTAEYGTRNCVNSTCDITYTEQFGISDITGHVGCGREGVSTNTRVSV